MKENDLKTKGAEEPDWYAGLRQRPELGKGFSAELMRNIRKRAVLSERRHGARFRTKAVVGAGLACLAAAAIWLGGSNGWPAFLPEIGSEKSINSGKADSGWRDYWSGGKKLLESVAGGDFAAGRQNGIWWNFYTPFEQIKDSRIRIDAIHQSGWKQTELNETVFSERGMEYVWKDGSKESFSRISSRFALPLAGKWRFEIYIDGNLWGDVEYDVPDAVWAESPTFASGAYMLRGVEGRVGIIDPGFIAGKGNKAMWHFWGNDKEIQGAVSIYGVQKGASVPLLLFESSETGGPNNGADAHMPSLMTMPTPGLWRLMAYIDGTLFGSIVVNVK